MALATTADEISVREVLDKLEAEFAPVAQAVENGEFALWVGSGISSQAPNLGKLIERAFDYLRESANDPVTAADFTPALEEALTLAEINPVGVRSRYGEPQALPPFACLCTPHLKPRLRPVSGAKRIGGTEGRRSASYGDHAFAAAGLRVAVSVPRFAPDRKTTSSNAIRPRTLT